MHACMKFYDAKNQLNLKTDASVIGLGTGLQQLRDGMKYKQDEAQDNTTLGPVAFACMSLFQAE